MCFRSVFTGRVIMKCENAKTKVRIVISVMVTVQLGLALGLGSYS